MIDFDRLNFDPGNMNKLKLCSFTTAKNSILKLVKLQILVAKSSKIQKTLLSQMWQALPTFPVRNTNAITNSQNS